jgi:hypothetical protein
MSESDESLAQQLRDLAISAAAGIEPKGIALDAFVTERKPSAQVISRALSMTAARAPNYTAASTVLNAYLQAALTGC